MASTFAMSPIHQPGAKFSGISPLTIGAVRRRRKETVNERVEHILRGALREAEEEALQEFEGDPETRGRVLQRSHQLASLYTTSTETKFLRSRVKRDTSLRYFSDTEVSKSPSPPAKTGPSSIYAGSTIGGGDESGDSDNDSCSVGRLVLASPARSRASWSPQMVMTSPVKLAKPWYNNSPTATLKEPIAPGITLDAKLHRYGARGTAKLLHGSRSQEILEPLTSPNRPVVPEYEFVTGLDGSPSLWPPEAFHPTGSRLRVTMTRCPSSPIAVSVEVPNKLDDHNNVAESCHLHEETQQNLQQKESQKLQLLYQREKQLAREERKQNQRDLSEWQSRTLHFKPSQELIDHRMQQQLDPQLRYRRTQVSAILQTPGYSPEKQRSQESSALRKKRFPLRWRSFARILDAMRRTPCRRPVLQDMEKLFALAKELCALNAVGTCMLSRAQFTQLVTREFPLCELKHVNRLFSSYDWELRDSVDARILLGAMRAMRVQQGESVELICASLRDFDTTADMNGKSKDDNKCVVSDGSCLAKALVLCCASDEEEKEMEERATMIWTKALSWQRQILARRKGGGSGYNVWKTSGAWGNDSSIATSNVAYDDTTSKNGEERELGGGNVEDEEETIDEIPELTRLVGESRVPIRRIRAALKREEQTLTLFTEQLLQRRRECLVAATMSSPRPR